MTLKMILKIYKYIIFQENKFFFLGFLTFATDWAQNKINLVINATRFFHNVLFR